MLGINRLKEKVRSLEFENNRLRNDINTMNRLTRNMSNTDQELELKIQEFLQNYQRIKKVVTVRDLLRMDDFNIDLIPEGCILMNQEHFELIEDYLILKGFKMLDTQ